MSKSKEKNILAVFGTAIKDYIKKDYKVLLTVFITFLVTAMLAFVRTATTSTISSFSLNDYEIGQIADITIIASKTLPADFDNPVSVEKGEKITRKGFVITEESYAKMKKIAESPAYIDYRAFADSVVYLLLMCAMFFLFDSGFRFYNKKTDFRELLLECSFYAITYALAVAGFKSAVFSSPYTVCVIMPGVFFTYLVAILFGQINAVFFSIMVSFAVLNVASYQVVPFLFTLATCFAATRIVRKIDRRVDMVFASILQALLNAVFMLVLKIIFDDSLSDAALALPGVAFNGFISGILCLGMLTPLELLLNTASPFRLMDLSDLNSPTMKKMLVTASGTYNHSMMVASLAEAACREIGANSLLARVGAYYHDIGKLDNPEYFVENQQGRENIHDEIKPSLSVSIIRSHVKRGVERAKALRLPPAVVSIISEHHGNQVISFFYNEAKQSDPSVNPEDYSYMGTPPSTRESAVVMLADTVEAACRTLEKKTAQRLDKFITVLINSKVEHHQLDNCGITFKDLSTVHDTFVQILAGYYHSRIEYPNQKDAESDEEHTQQDAANAQAAQAPAAQEEARIVTPTVEPEKPAASQDRQEKPKTERHEAEKPAPAEHQEKKDSAPKAKSKRKTDGK